MLDASRWCNSIVRPFQRLAALFRPQGASPAHPYTYILASWAFLRLLGLVYVMAFGSLWIQLDGLIGREGIVPVAPLLAAAQYRLGILLTKGQGIESDRVAAYKWFMLSQDSIKQSAAELNDLRHAMSPAEIAEAEHQVDAWRTEHKQSHN